MKKVKVVVLLFIVGVTICFVSCTILPLFGNGNITTSERTVSSFQKINSSGTAEVRYYASQDYRVVVTTDSNLIENVTTEIRNNTLNIGTKMGSYSFTKLLVEVYCPVLTGVTISGSGDFSSNETITAPAFEVDLSGSGKIAGTIECDNFSATISGSGKITVSGNSSDLNINVLGSGNFNGNDLNTNNAVVRVSGSGKADINVTGKLNVTISGSGRVNYRGNPTIESSKITGSGKINKV